MTNARNSNNQKTNENGGNGQPDRVDIADPYHENLPMGAYRISCQGKDLHKMLEEFVAYLQEQYPAYVKAVDIRRIRHWIASGMEDGTSLCCILAFVEEHLIFWNDLDYRRKLVPHRTIEDCLLCPRCAAQMGYIAPLTGPQRPDRWMRMLAA
jgi:hypothetical protein